MNLSKAQQEVIKLMSDGWEMGQSMVFDGGYYLQKGGIGRGGKSKRLNANTACALKDRGIVICFEHKFPSALYKLANN